MSYTVIWNNNNQTFIYLRDICSNIFVFADSEVVGELNSHTRRTYSPEGIYYDCRSRKFYDLFAIHENCEYQASLNSCDLRSLTSSSSRGSGGSREYGSGVYCMSPDQGQGNSPGGTRGADGDHGEDKQGE